MPAANPPAAPDALPPAAIALTLALVGLVLPLHLPIDVDRTLPLLFIPALWLSWRVAAPQLSRWETLLLGWTACALVLSTAFAPNPAAALAMCAAIGLALSGAAVARRLAASPYAVRLVLAGLLIGPLIGFATVLAGWGADRMFFPTYWSARLFGAHAFSGALAGLALLLLPGLKRPARILVACGTLAAWTALAWSGSRAPALGLAVALLVWFWRADRPVRRALLIAVPVLGLLALACSRPLGIPYPQLGWWPAITRTVEASNAFEITSQRTSYWEASWKDFKLSPLVGRGADAYQFITPKQPGNQPHNTYLQWLLEYGLLGAPAFLLLLARCLRPLLPSRSSRSSASVAGGDEFSGVARWASAAIAGAAVYAFFDGVAYHMVAMMPLAVIAGLTWRSVPPNPLSGPIAAVVTRPPAAVRAAALLALVVLLLHTWLGQLLLHGHAVSPDSMPARALRIFPSTTHGLLNWTNRWLDEDATTGLAWVKWATTVSNQPAVFHLQAAQFHLWAKDWPAAESELAAALDKVTLSERPDVQHLLDEIRAIIANSSAPAAPPPTTPVATP